MVPSTTAMSFFKTTITSFEKVIRLKCQFGGLPFFVQNLKMSLTYTVLRFDARGFFKFIQHLLILELFYGIRDKVRNCTSGSKINI